MKWLAFCALTACTTTDDRPQTLAFITETILAPNCASAECHGPFVKQSHYVFDTVEHAQQSIANGALIVPSDPANSYLIQVITTADNFGNRMPWDHPLANKDIFLIGQWIENGADGYVAP